MCIYIYITIYIAPFDTAYMSWHLFLGIPPITSPLKHREDIIKKVV
jgi:hypothetical protein